MSTLALEQLSKRFPNGVVGVNDLNLRVDEGELLVLVGPSGCGKTTTLRLIAGLETPSSGTVQIDGRIVNARPPHERNLAFVFQWPALYPHLSVRDNLLFGLRLQVGARQARRETERLAQIAEMLGLAQLLDRRPAELSGGEQQRTALGRALVRRTGLILLDEPLSSLDAPLRADMRRELHLLHRRLRATMVYVTHDQVEATTLGDRVAVMHQGRILQVDRPDVLYHRPSCRFVAGFIGWPPMNLIDGSVRVRQGQMGFGSGDLWLPLAPELVVSEGSPAILGVRPEHVRIGAVGFPMAASVPVRTMESAPEEFRMEVRTSEWVGGRWLLTLERDGLHISALVDERPRVDEGQGISVSWDMKHVHYFDQHGERVRGREMADD